MAVNINDEPLFELSISCDDIESHLDGEGLNPDTNRVKFIAESTAGEAFFDELKEEMLDRAKDWFTVQYTEDALDPDQDDDDDTDFDE